MRLLSAIAIVMMFLAAVFIVSLLPELLKSCRQTPKLPPFIVVCDGHGRYSYTDQDGEISIYRDFASFEKAKQECQAEKSGWDDAGARIASGEIDRLIKDRKARFKPCQEAEKSSAAIDMTPANSPTFVIKGNTFHDSTKP